MDTTAAPIWTGDAVADYHRAQDGFDAVLAAVPADRWDTPSACTEWTVRDVVGHVVWGQHLVHHLAEGTPFTDRTGAPGSPAPAALAGPDPLARWREARAATTAVLTGPGLDRPAPPQYAAAHPGARLRDFLAALALDFLAHTWDVGHPLGIPVHPDPGLVDRAAAAAPGIVIRAPGAFAAALTPPPDADPFTRLLAFLGR